MPPFLAIASILISFRFINELENILSLLDDKNTLRLLFIILLTGMIVEVFK